MTSKIAILLPDLRGGGAERVKLDLAHAFAAKGVAVEFVLLKAQGELLDEVEKHFVIHDLGCDRMRNVPRSLAQYLKLERPDVLVAAMWPLTVLAPFALAMARVKCRIIMSEHGVLSAQYKSWGRLHRVALRASMAAGYRMGDVIVAVSSGVADDLAALSGLPRRMFTVIHNPVRRSAPASVEELAGAERLWGVAAGARILTVGRFKAVKNHPLLLRAFSQMAQEDARLMLVGNGENEAELRQIADQLGISGRVIFAGFQQNPAPFYETADLFVLSSNNEGFGNVLVEALAVGTPIVSTKCPAGPEEILENGRYGTLTPVGDEAALAKAMSEALHAPNAPEELKKRAADFSIERAASAYLNVMDLK